MSLRNRETSRSYGATKTQQAPALDADINRITSRHLGPVPSAPGAHVQPNWTQWAPADFQAQLNAVMEAKIAFQALPSRIRSLFGNSPYELVRWINNPANLDRAIELHLISPPEGYKPPVAHRTAQQMDMVVASLQEEIAALKAAKTPEGGIPQP